MVNLKCCFGWGKKNPDEGEDERNKNKSQKRDDDQNQPSSSEPRRVSEEDQLSLDAKGLNLTEQARANKAKTFTFQELARATKHFRSARLLGEGGFGKVYRGTLKIDNTNQVVAIKHLNLSGVQGIKEFVSEVLTLSNADHPNLVKFIGYCAQGDQRLLVYEYVPRGSLEDLIHDLPSGEQPLDWETRMKIAVGAARGLEYLHTVMVPPVIHRDLKSANILLSRDYEPKLSDFGLAKFGPIGGQTHVSTMVMGTYGYCAPDYAMTGQLTFKSDVYSFGVLMLEIITGMEAMDRTRPPNQKDLAGWARPLLKNHRKFLTMVDPLLGGQFPKRALYNALKIAELCIQLEPNMRPQASEIVQALSHVSTVFYKNFFTSIGDSSIGESSSSRTRRDQDKDGGEKKPDVITEAKPEGETS